MAALKRNTIKRIIVASVWVLLGIGVVGLLIAAISKKDTQKLSRVEVSISGVQNHFFIDEKEVLRIIEKVHKGPLAHSLVGALDLVSMEKALLKEAWIQSAELFIDNNQVLQVQIYEREPVARIFTTSGESFYIDSSLSRLPLSSNFSARLPVFTGFPTDVLVLTKKDSALLRSISTLGQFIEQDAFWMAQIDQVDITTAGTFELIPKIGNQVIRFGSLDRYEEKFNNLLAFYKKVQVQAGWNRYSALDVQYRGQVVAVRRDAVELKADSLRAVQVMKKIIADAQRKTNDTTHVQLRDVDNPVNINYSRVIDELPEENDIPPTAPVPAPATAPKPVKAPVKPVPAPAPRKEGAPVAPVKKEQKKEEKKIDKKETNKPKTPRAVMPKAVMPPRSNE